MKKFREFRKEQAKYDYGTPESVKLMKKVTPGQAAEARISYDNRLKNKIGRASDEPDGDDYSSRRISQQSHAVHVNGKKWKSFPSAAMANKAAQTIKDRHGKTATVHKEEVNEISTDLKQRYAKKASSDINLTKKDLSIAKDMDVPDVKKKLKHRLQTRRIGVARATEPATSKNLLDAKCKK